MHASANEAEDEESQREQQKPANLTPPLLLPGMRHLRWTRRSHPCLLRPLVVEIVDAQLEIWAVELAGQRRELTHSGDGAPRGTVERRVLG